MRYTLDITQADGYLEVKAANEHGESITELGSADLPSMLALAAQDVAADYAHDSGVG